MLRKLCSGSRCLERSIFWKPTIPERNLFLTKGVLWEPKMIEFHDHIWVHIKSEALKTWKYCKIIYRDGKWFLKKQLKMKFFDESITIKERHKMTATKSDLLKMIPFSFFIIVPGAELTLPIFLYLFPNMIPSAFISKTKEEKKIIHMLDSRNTYAEYLYKFMIAKAGSDKGNKKLVDLLLKDPQSLSKPCLVEHQKEFRRLFRFNDMDTHTLINVCRLLTIEPLTGFKLIGKLIVDPYLRLKSRITKDHKIDSWIPQNIILDSISRFIILYQLLSHIKRIREDDYLLLVDDYDDISMESIIKCCRERAIETESTTNSRVYEELKEWVTFSTNPQSSGRLNHEFIVLTQVFPYLHSVIYEDDPKSITSGERTKVLMQRINMTHFFEFSELEIYLMFEFVRFNPPEIIPPSIRKYLIDEFKRILDEKVMPDDEDQILGLIKTLESVILFDSRPEILKVGND
ncbi:hypothetical protein SteCoe_20023 [Stentor coeruleus]|uniref:Letm1 RBD domain-containing protein n=1 Tax=Stentor coeruleus TaxID=5963 RepID=A0A1R2BT83_9CILI|nr:hypothetical protein SteCoe_20023 [Stentor coeruleus]